MTGQSLVRSGVLMGCESQFEGTFCLDPLSLFSRSRAGSRQKPSRTRRRAPYSCGNQADGETGKMVSGKLFPYGSVLSLDEIGLNEC